MVNRTSMVSGNSVSVLILVFVEVGLMVPKIYLMINLQSVLILVFVEVGLMDMANLAS